MERMPWPALTDAVSPKKGPTRSEPRGITAALAVLARWLASR